MHWTRDPKNKEKLAKAAAKRAKTRRRRGKRSNANSGESVRYATPRAVAVLKAELRDAQKRVTALRGILQKYQRLG